MCLPLKVSLQEKSPELLRATVISFHSDSSPLQSRASETRERTESEEERDRERETDREIEREREREGERKTHTHTSERLYLHPIVPKDTLKIYR